MAWFSRIDRYGSVHMVRSQDTVMKGGSDSSNSCGIASMLMVNFKVKKHLLLGGVVAGAGVSAVPIIGTFIGKQLVQAAIDSAIKSEPEVYKIYSDVVGSVYDGSVASDCSQFPEVMRRLSLGEWETVWVGWNNVYDGIKTGIERGYPVIARVAWDNDATGAAGHFVCIDEVHSLFGNTASVCDPWDGELRIVPGPSNAPMKYDPNGYVFSTGSLFGGNAHSYGVSPTGTFNWIVRKKA